MCSISCSLAVPEHLGWVVAQIVLKPDDVADYLGSFYFWRYLSGFIFPNLNFLHSGIYPHILMKACWYIGTCGGSALPVPLHLGFHCRVRLTETFLKLLFIYFFFTKTICFFNYSAYCAVASSALAQLIRRSYNNQIKERRKYCGADDLWAEYVTSCSFCTPQ